MKLNVSSSKHIATNQGAVSEFAMDQVAFFKAFTKAWVKLQENGVEQDLKTVIAAPSAAPIPTPADVSAITADLKALISEKNCGPIMIRLSWHDVSPNFMNLNTSNV